MLDFLTLDREVHAAAAALQMHALAGSVEQAPLIRRSVSTLEAARELEPFVADAVAGGIQRWMLHLTVLRATAADREAMRASFEEPADETSTRTVAEHVRGLLAGAADRALATQTLQDSHARVMDPSLRWYERTREAQRRAGVVAIDARGVAEEIVKLLGAIDDEPTPWHEVIERGLSRARGEGWPAHLTPRTVMALVGSEWFEGVRLPSIKLPQPLGVGSFARALTDLGAGFATMDRDVNRPFALSRAPRDGLVHRRAALFGSLVLSEAFHRRRFGVAAHVAKEEVRAIARASTVWLRVAALRVLMTPELLGDQRASAFEELTHRIFGRPWPGRLAAVVPRLDADAGERIVGIVRAEVDRRALRDRFDDDWFDNPRAHVWIRHEHHQSTLERVESPPDASEVPLLIDRLSETLDG